MNLVDIIIIILLALGFLAGFKRGLIKQGVLTIGIILVVVLAFLLKDPLSMVLYKHCPFFTFGVLKNYSVLNILLYELISFFILFSLFGIILGIVVKVSGIVERFVRATVILALPSKILGGIVGIIEMFVILYIVLFIVTMPIFSVSKNKMLRESNMKNTILNNTLLISHLGNGVSKSGEAVTELLDSKDKLGTEEFNCKALKIFLENKIVSKDSIKYLEEKGKIDSSCKIQ